MRIKRVLQGTALTALAAAAWMGAATVDASAAEFPVGNVSVYLNGDEEGNTSPYIFVDAEGCKEIMFGVASYNANKGVKIADTAWDVYDVEETGYATIDLSKLSITKDNYVAIKSESTTPIYIKIGASVTSQTTKYDACKSELDITIKKGSSTTVSDFDWEYRTSFGNWSELPLQIAKKNEDGYVVDKDDNYFDRYSGYICKKDGTPLFLKGDKENPAWFKFVPEMEDNKDLFKEYQYQGATLYVRAAAKDNDEYDTDGNREFDKPIKTDLANASDNTIKYNLYDAGSMPGKETKVSIAKQANGPSVSVDYVKGSVTIPAKTEYRVVATDGAMYASGTAISAITDNSAKKPVSVSELLKDGDNTLPAGTLEVRKVAAGKKSASRWTRVELQMPVALVLEDGITEETVATSGVIVSKGITIGDYNAKKGKISIKNDSGKDINVIIATSKPTDPAAKSTTIKNTKSVEITAGNGQTVYIRTAGVKKDKAWAGDYTAVGKIKLS